MVALEKNLNPYLLEYNTALIVTYYAGWRSQPASKIR